MKFIYLLLLTIILAGCSSCSFVGNSPMEKKHRQGLPSTPNN